MGYQIHYFKVADIRPYDRNPRDNTKAVEKVDCIQLTNLSEQEQKAFRIADNRVADFSVWNDKMLQEEMRDISAEDWEKFGFSEKLLEKVNAPEMTTCPKCGRQFIKI